MLPFKKNPTIDYCRDGGSIEANYIDFWGNDFLLTLPIKMEGTSIDNVKAVGYLPPKLTKYSKEKKISKGNGKPYYVTREVQLELTSSKALSIAKKLIKATDEPESIEACKKIIYAIKNNGQFINS